MARRKKNVRLVGERMRILITGASSGLGKYVASQLEHYTSYEVSLYDRSKPDEYIGPYDLIVHCACNPIKDNLYEAYSNVTLLERLLTIKTEKFVLISTADVYPKVGPRVEYTDIDFNSIDNLYGKMKFLCEEILRNREQKHLILRPAGLLGEYCRNNVIVRMINNEDTTTLSAGSRLSYITHSYVYNLIFSKLQGTYNISSLDSMNLGEINEMLGFPIKKFGEYYGRFGGKDLTKLGLEGYLFPTCGEVIKEFVLERRSQDANG
jgi:nucleoside-diphosphate-sugar epimerase